MYLDFVKITVIIVIVFVQITTISLLLIACVVPISLFRFSHNSPFTCLFIIRFVFLHPFHLCRRLWGKSEIMAWVQSYKYLTLMAFLNLWIRRFPPVDFNPCHLIYMFGIFQTSKIEDNRTLLIMSEPECCSGNLVILGLLVIAVGQKKFSRHCNVARAPVLL